MYVRAPATRQPLRPPAALEPAFDDEASEAGPIHILAIEHDLTIGADHHGLEWNGSPGRDLVYDLSIAISPAGCAPEEAAD